MRGGARRGAGRPEGSGKFGEPTCPIRVPVSQVEAIMGFLQKESFSMPLYECRVAAGFPSPADSNVERELDLNELLIKRPAATFFVRVSGFSMVNAGIHDNDILVVDRSLDPLPGKIVVAAVNGELTVKRFCREGKTVILKAESEGYPSLIMDDEVDLRIWGVVTSVIHSV